MEITYLLPLIDTTLSVFATRSLATIATTNISPFYIYVSSTPSLPTKISSPTREQPLVGNSISYVEWINHRNIHTVLSSIHSSHTSYCIQDSADNKDVIIVGSSDIHYLKEHCNTTGPRLFHQHKMYRTAHNKRHSVDLKPIKRTLNTPESYQNLPEIYLNLPEFTRN